MSYIGSEVKYQTHDILLETLREHLPAETTPDMPCWILTGSSMIFERKLHQEYGDKLSIESVEKDPHTYIRALRQIEISRVPVTIHPMEDDTYWFFKAKDKKFRFCWFDWCGPMTPEKLNLVANVIGNNLVLDQHEPIFAFTVQNGRHDHRALDLVRELTQEEIQKNSWGRDNGEKNDNMLRYWGYLSTIQELLKRNNYQLNLSPLKIVPYKNFNYGANMLLVVAKASKKEPDFSLVEINKIN